MSKLLFGGFSVFAGVFVAAIISLVAPILYFYAGVLPVPIAAFVSAAIFSRLVLAADKSPDDADCRCRSCHSVLRGLREPNCPACGEHI